MAIQWIMNEPIKPDSWQGTILLAGLCDVQGAAGAKQITHRPVTGATCLVTFHIMTTQLLQIHTLICYEGNLAQKQVQTQHGCSIAYSPCCCTGLPVV